MLQFNYNHSKKNKRVRRNFVVSRLDDRVALMSGVHITLTVKLRKNEERENTSNRI